MATVTVQPAYKKVKAVAKNVCFIIVLANAKLKAMKIILNLDAITRTMFFGFLSSNGNTKRYILIKHCQCPMAYYVIKMHMFKYRSIKGNCESN
jgi:hypothetical protein